MSIQKEKERYLFILIVSDDDRQLCGQSRPVELPIVDLDGKEVNVAHIEIFSFINIAAYFNMFTTSILGSPPNSTAEVPGLLLPLLPARGSGFFRTLLFLPPKKLGLPPTGFHLFQNFVPKVTLAQSGMGLASVEQEWSWILPNLVVKDQVIS